MIPFIAFKSTPADNFKPAVIAASAVNEKPVFLYPFTILKSPLLYVTPALTTPVQVIATPPFSE